MDTVDKKIKLEVNLTPLRDEEGNLILCSTVCVLGSLMKDCKNCKQLTVFIEKVMP